VIDATKLAGDVVARLDGELELEVHLSRGSTDTLRETVGRVGRVVHRAVRELVTAATTEDAGINGSSPIFLSPRGWPFCPTCGDGQRVEMAPPTEPPLSAAIRVSARRSADWWCPCCGWEVRAAFGASPGGSIDDGKEF